MFVPKSKKQNDAVVSIAYEILGSPIFWIGITDAGTEGEWTYGDGSVINFENWAPGKPGFPDFDDCAFVSTHSGPEVPEYYGKWIDNLCDKHFDVICEF